MVKVEKVRSHLAKDTPKKKCCRSKKRCCKCPVVLKRLMKINALELDDEALKKALKKARRW